MTVIKPLGAKILVKKIDKPNHITESNIEVVGLELSYGEVVEVGNEVENLFKKGDTVMFPSGAGHGEYYNGERCLWLTGLPVNQNGDVWGIVTENK